MYARTASILALSIAVLSPAQAAAALTAATGTADGAESADQGPILVTGQRPEYGATSTRSGTRTETDVKDVPQSLTVISEAQIEDQALRSIADVLNFVPGATPGTGEANRDQITLRGNNTTADFFVDGVRDDVQYFRDLYNAERVEILRGPNAMIFGRGGGGGVVNRVLKRASGGDYREFAFSADSRGGYRLTGDVDQPLAEGAGVRINGVYENGDSFRRFVDLERYGINPTVGIVTGGTRIDLSYEYFHDWRTTDRGVPAIDGRPVQGFDRTFFGDPDLSFAEADVHVGTLAVEHQLADGLTLRNRTLVGRYDKFYQNVFPSAVVPATPARPTGVRLGAYNSRNDRTNAFSQTDLVWDGALGGLEHTLLLGFEVGRQESRNLRQSGAFAGSSEVPLSDPTTSATVSFAPAASDANNRTEATVAALYVQEQLRLSSMLELVAGLRYDHFELDVDDLRGAGAELGRSDDLLSPRLGLIVKPSATLSLYASYGRSYLPSSGDQFSGLDLTTERLKPERFDNYELGLKWEPLAGLLATAAIYQLDRTNTRAVDPLTLLTVQTGAQRSRGLEIGLERNISDKWQISAGYAWQEAEIRRTTAAAPAGREVPLVPRHQFSAWNRYDVSDRLGFGLGAIARSKSFASISNNVILPSYVRFDGAIFYELAEGLEAQVNVENLFGADYFPTAHSDNNIAPGAPTTARASLRLRF